MRPSSPVRRPTGIWLIVALAAMTGTTSASGVSGRPEVLGGQRTSVSHVVTATDADAVRVTQTLVEDMRQRKTLRLVDAASDPLVAGHTHWRFAQYHGGVRVLGSDVTVQTKDGAPTSVFGRIRRHLDIGTRPTLGQADVASLVGHATGDVPDAHPSLAILTDPSGGADRLVYEVRTFGPGGPTLHDVDAHTGDIVSARSPVRTQHALLPCVDCAVGEGRGIKGDRKKVSVRRVFGMFGADDRLRHTRVSTYDMRGDWSRVVDVLNERDTLSDGDLALDSDNDWGDGASVDAHTATGWTLDYLYHRFGRDGFDGQNGPLAVLVHPVHRSDLFSVPDDVSVLFHLNAFFCRSCGPGDMLVFGEGLPPGQTLGGTGRTVDYFAAGLDIVAHEIGHAVIEYTSRLAYRGESGALSEAFSDLLGVGTEFFVAESRRHRIEEAEYLVGEDVIKPGGIRSLSDPLSLGDPDHYTLRFLGSADNGGVHTNSTIVTHAYYLMIEGGTNRTSGVTVFGLGRQARPLIEQIFYRALVFLLPTDATFSMARAATLQSARDMTSDPVVEHTIQQAWTAVGVE